MSIERIQAPIVWFTGLSGAGKTTLSEEVERALAREGVRSYLLDAGMVRQQLFPDLGYTQEDRHENVRRLGVLATMTANCGAVTLVAAMSPERAARDAVRRSVECFVEVFVDAPVSVCEVRDPVGLYRRFRLGEIQHVSGLDDPYEPPQNPEVHCRTAEQALAACASMVVDVTLAKLRGMSLTQGVAAESDRISSLYPSTS